MKQNTQVYITPKTVDSSGSTTVLLNRRLLKIVFAGVALIAMLAGGCQKDDINDGQTNWINQNVNLGKGDTAILNYAFALEQLEAAFYVNVVSSTNFKTIFSTAEQGYLTDIRDHELAHREYLRVILIKQGLKSLEFDFSSINFNDRASLLNNAKTLKNMSVSAYNGVGFLIINPNFLLSLGKITSVESRHASAINDMLKPGSFSDPLTTDGGTVDADGLNISRSPAQVLDIAGKYIKTALVITGLPNY